MLWVRCGHPRTPDNTKRVGQSARTGEPKYGCKTCQRASAKASARRWYHRGQCPRPRTAQA